MKLQFFLAVICLGAVVCEDPIVFNYLPLDIKQPVNASRVVRSVGGYDAPGKDFRYMTRLHLQLGGGAFIMCGGALISLTHILTADHCIPDNLKNIDAHFNVERWEWSAKVHPVAWYVRRGQGTNPFVDLAILGLPEPVTITDKIAPIPLPRLSQVKDFFVDRDGLIVGYGGVTDDVLKQTPMRFTPSSGCGTSIGMVCAKGRDGPHQSAAAGDSGGPIVLLDNGIHILVGTLSFHYGDHTGGTHLPQFLGWINQVTGIPME